MIRPLSQKQLQSLEKSRVFSYTASALMKSGTMASTSPIHMHRQHASVVASTTFPCSFLAHDGALSSPSSHKATLRASVLQSVLHLLGQDGNALSGVQEILEIAATLPLSDASVQRACVVALRDLQQQTAGPSFVNHDSTLCNSCDAPAFSVKSTQPVNDLTADSFHHCKKFLRACGNEIHELDEMHASSEDANSTRSFSSRDKETELRPELLCTHGCAANIQYSSTVQVSSTRFSGSAVCSDIDDTDANQGSELSDVVYRAEFLSDMDEPLSDHEVPTIMSSSDRLVLQELHKNVASQRRRLKAMNFVTKYRVFTARKLQASLRRKRSIFQRLQSILRSRSRQEDVTKHYGVVTGERFFPTLQTLRLHQLDVLLVLLFLVAFVHLPFSLL
ncbi:hypothetical protein PsorP6_007265 [Peronosclerospora sorghi]|uniref:Uncharacterized protein n=1 Tax=Peronosclerospora sorghi TaxID=230839 RepID=A0ACC0WBV2_9STRA|nr:hypothetical protein PsorP6_007265 [Peronosclerospora sorghi]